MTPDELYAKVAAPLILKVEGGYVNDPLDPGGETKWGISKRAYPHLNIAELTEDDAVAIYKSDYWDPTGGKIADIAPAIALFIFDWAVNSGIKTAVKRLQKAVNVTQDGQIGPKTRAAVATTDLDELSAGLFASRVQFYKSLKGWARFGRGWMSRLARIKNSMAACDAPVAGGAAISTDVS